MNNSLIERMKSNINEITILKKLMKLMIVAGVVTYIWNRRKIRVI